MKNILSINDSDVGYEDFSDEILVIKDAKIILKKEVVEECELENEVELLA